MQLLRVAPVRLGSDANRIERTTFKLLVLIVLSTLVAARGESEFSQNAHSDLNDKSPQVGQRPISETSNQLLARTKRSFASSDEFNKKANESQEQAAQIIEFRSSDNQIPAASPNFEAAFQGECSKDRHRPNLCDHICLDLYDGTFECACHYGFALSVDGYSCTRHRALDISVATTTGNLNGAQTTTTTTDSPPYELITHATDNLSGHMNRATKWTSRVEPPSILISNSSSSSLAAQGRVATSAGGSRHAIRKLASEPERRSEAPRRVGGGGGSAGNRRHQSGPGVDLASQDLPLGGGGQGELKFQDDRAADTKRQRARQVDEWRDGGGRGRRARASAAERAQWKLPSRRQHERQDSKPFDGDAASQRDETEGEDFVDSEEEERQELAGTNNDEHSLAAASNQRRKDDLQGNWILPAPIWTRRAGRDQQDEDNSPERQPASAGEAAKTLQLSATDGSSKLEPKLIGSGEEEDDEDDDDEQPPHPRWSSFDRSDDAAQDSPAQDGGGLGLALGGEEDQEEEEEREHQALERELGLLENLIGKTMADYRNRPRWPPKLG